MNMLTWLISLSDCFIFTCYLCCIYTSRDLHFIFAPDPSLLMHVKFTVRCLSRNERCLCISHGRHGGCLKIRFIVFNKLSKSSVIMFPCWGNDIIQSLVNAVYFLRLRLNDFRLKLCFRLSVAQIKERIEK